MQIHRIIFWLCTLFFLNEVQSQSLLQQVKNLDFSSEYTQLKTQVDSLLILGKSENNLEALTLLTGNFSVKEYREKHHEHAIYYGNLAVEYQKNQHLVDEDLALLLFRLALYHSRNNQIEEALRLYEEVISVDTAPTRTAQAYCQIGQIYGDRGDFYLAIQYYKNGIGLLEDQKAYGSLSRQYPNLAIVYDKIGTKESLLKELEVLDKTKALAAEIQFHPQQIFSLNDNLASIYANEITFDFKKARHYYDLNLKAAIQQDDSLNECYTYTNLADLYNIAKKDSAKHFIQKALQICQDSESLSVAHHQYSKYYSIRKEYSDALNAIHTSLLINLNIQKSVDYIPTTRDFVQANNNYSVLIDLSEKVNVLVKYYEHNQDKSNLDLALQNVQAADEVISLLQKASEEEESQLFWRKEASNIYHQGVAICALLDRPQLAFHFTEKNKALLLTESILQNAKKKELPVKIRSKEDLLKKQILTLKNGIDTIQDPKELKVKQRVIFETNLKYQNYQDSLQLAFPKYYESKTKSEIFPVSIIQENLQNDLALISYIWDKNNNSSSALHGLITTQNQSYIFEVEGAEEIKNLVPSFRTSISKPYETVEDRRQFRKISYTLYSKLFPEHIRTLIENKNLVIIPDGELQYIPFEALITQVDTDHFLIKNHQISYAYSASFLLHNNSIQRETQDGFAGFAPVHFAHNDLESLSNSAKEIENIQRVTNGTQYLEKQASKANFFAQAQRHKIIHLATHADASSNPWIAFHDAKLEAHELYTLENPAELVVLSGCNTSLGEIAQGEGVMSLSRGFFYAGAHSVAATLWSVNDKSTASIMTSFYDHLKSGESKAAALQNAKLAYLDQSSLSESSPYYWAPVVLMGDGQKILYPSSSTGIVTIVILLIILIILTIAIKKKRKNKIHG